MGDKERSEMEFFIFFFHEKIFFLALEYFFRVMKKYANVIVWKT